jgi:hypothetical protein
MSEEKHKISRAERKRIERKAKKLLQSRHFLNKFLSAIEKMGLVGEKGNAEVVYVVATSCILDRPLNLFVKGQSSSGKNWLVTRVLHLLPKSDVREITSASEQAWSYSRSDFRHRVVYLQERNEAAGRMDPMRLLISEGRLVRIVTQYEGGKRVARKFVARGPVAAISTTTKNRLQIDDETRHISIWVDESNEQTREIVKAYARGFPGLRHSELEVWRMAYRLLKERVGIEIVLPTWLEQVAEEIFVDDKRVRRYFPAFIEALRTISLIRSFLPDHHRRNGRLEVDFADFAITTLIFDRVFVESLGLGKSAAEATRRSVERISVATGKPVEARELARELKISKDKAYSKLRYAEQAGVIRIANKPEKSNRKTFLALPAPHFVPDSNLMFHKLGLKDAVRFVHPLTGEWIVYKPKH